MPEICDWNDIKSDFNAGLILGNGASRDVDDSFRYEKLYDISVQQGLITPNVSAVFEYFETTDFEFVLRMLWNAYNVNRSLGISDDVTIKTYQDIRLGLVQSVKAIHSGNDRIRANLPKIANFLKGFRTIACLNYDLIVYWAMLAYNNNEPNRFKDCFTDGRHFDEGWQRLREPYGQAEEATLVFYPHGNLALAYSKSGREEKLITGNHDCLVDSIVGSWNTGDYSPLFVSEGLSTQKIQAIRRSFYLSTVYDEILPKEFEASIVSYGWNFGENDVHILEALRKNNISKFAVSVYQENNNVEEYCSNVTRQIRTIIGNHVEIIFFDSQSQGCWIN